MASLLIRGLGRLVTGDWMSPLSKATSIYVEDGTIREIGTNKVTADTVIDAKGLLAMPGLIDTHSHPSFGDFAPAQSSIGWTSSYLHGGTTTLISAGESQVPGFPVNPPEPRLCKYLAVLIKRCWENLGVAAPRVLAGTLLLVPGLKEADFDEAAEDGIRFAKFLFYPYDGSLKEAKAYMDMCKQRGIVVKLHSGGVSGSGANSPADWRVIEQLRPDVVAHINGGPIAMPLRDIEAIVKGTECFLEVSIQGSIRRLIDLMAIVVREGAEARVIVGTDTPSPSGVIPRAMLRTVALLGSITSVAPEIAICMATGNAGKSHRLRQGLLKAGQPADLLLVGTIQGSVADDVLEAMKHGEIPGISCVVVDGDVVVSGRSRITPPPISKAEVTTLA